MNKQDVEEILATEKEMHAKTMKAFEEFKERHKDCYPGNQYNLLQQEVTELRAKNEINDRFIGIIEAMAGAEQGQECTHCHKKGHINNNNMCVLCNMYQ